MKYKYDLHIHSGLSPCADKDMTPADIVAFCKVSGLDIIAIADHNATENVEVALKAADFYGITVVAATEIQTAEDVHMLCLFESFEKLKEFKDGLSFQQIENRPDIFGEQNIYDEDDNIIGNLQNLLLVSCDASCEQVYKRAAEFGGIAIPAHIDREANGMLCILGGVSDLYRVVEISTTASELFKKDYADRLVLVDSDAHCFSQISEGAEIELEEPTAKALLLKLRNCR